MKHLPRIAARVATGMTWLAMIAAAATLALVAVGPRVLGYHTESVLSGSMVPTFSPGDAVLVTSEPATSVRVGQIISYHIPVGDHHVETHRIVRVLSHGRHPVVVTKGDANPAPDPWHARLDSPNVWRTRMVIPYLGTAIHDLRTPIASTLTTRIAPAVIVVLLLIRIWSPEHRPDPRAAE